MTKLKCQHCFHEWNTRYNKDPKLCPSCKTKNYKQKPKLKYIPKTKVWEKGEFPKTYFGVKDELNQGPTAIALLKQRYLLKDKEDNIIETPKGMFRRVAHFIAQADKNYNQDIKKTEKEFYNMLINFEFIPNTPTLINSNTPLQQLSACFVLPVHDSLKEIFKTLTNTALITQGGGGVGFNFSELRPEGDIVRTTHGVASGPTSFIRIFDITTEVIKSGGVRRGAMMGILNYNHPDIVKFITAKSKEGILTNFNLSISLTDKFMQHVKNNKSYWLINPRNNKKVEKINARNIFNLIAQNAWQHGDPGLIFIDEINRHNPIPPIPITATNPCSEQPLHDYSSCNLGSINLNKFVKNKKIDWGKLKKIIHLSVHFLDNVIDMNKFVIPEIEKVTKQNRPIGLGILGWADFLIKLNIPYNSEKALRLTEKLIKFITTQARKASIELAKIRGSFPNHKNSIWKNLKFIRHSQITTIPPTGSISIVCQGASSGIEPLFAISYTRKILDKEFLEINKEFEKIAKERGFYSKHLMKRIAKTGSVQEIKEIPNDVKKIFITALDISPDWHVKMQAAFQRFVDSSISKTVNLPEKATIEDVKKIFMLAYKLRCKGITIYRYGSKKEQVLNIGKKIKVYHEYSGGCPYRKCLF